jgi:hypothetical protein
VHLSQAFVERILMGKKHTGHRTVGGDSHAIHDGISWSKQGFGDTEQGGV